jgi:DNA-binding transcriptional ArsR family regulator
MSDEFAVTANLLGEPARAAILLKLMGGRALPAGELAEGADVTPQTASGHLAKLMEGRLIRMERQGRHRYYRLAGAEVADAIEALLVLTAKARGSVRQQPAPPVVGTLAYARTCYSHLAGWLGVQIADALQAKGLLAPAAGKAFAITESGRAWFEEIGIAGPFGDQRTSPKLARRCLDWTERRPHVAGALGVGMYRRFVELRWIAPTKNARAVRVTLEGKQELWRRLKISLG